MDNWGGDEKWLDSGHILKVEHTGLVKGLDVEWEKRVGVLQCFWPEQLVCHFLNWRRLQETARQFCPSTDKFPFSHHLPNYPLDLSHYYLLPSCSNSLQIGLSASTLTPLQSVLNTAVRLKKMKKKKVISGGSSTKSPNWFSFSLRVRWWKVLLHVLVCYLSDPSSFLLPLFLPHYSLWSFFSLSVPARIVPVSASLYLLFSLLGICFT